MFRYKIYYQPLSSLPEAHLLINTLNAHSYNVAQIDDDFDKALRASDVLLPDGIGIVWAHWWLTGTKVKKIAGADLFYHEMRKLENIGGKCLFLGSNEDTLEKIRQKTKREFPRVEVKTYPPPYKEIFTEEDNKQMLNVVNTFMPDVLFIGMTAPKQEKWAYQHFTHINAGHICCIGAVFDYYAGTVLRAPQWMIVFGFEWFYRFLREPRRMWRRYLVGNLKFVFAMIKEKFVYSKITSTH